MDLTKDLEGSQPVSVEERAVLEALRRGYQSRDAALLASVYTDAAEFTICNRNNPPTKRLVLRGREAVRRMFDDLCAREMTHRMAHMTIGSGSIAFSTHCEYPDGCRVVALNIATVKEGRIVSEISVDCWDE
jgi:ketosteroid isomerase-like protein